MNYLKLMGKRNKQLLLQRLLCPNGAPSLGRAACAADAIQPPLCTDVLAAADLLRTACCADGTHELLCKNSRVQILSFKVLDNQRKLIVETSVIITKTWFQGSELKFS